MSNDLEVINPKDIPKRRAVSPQETPETPQIPQEHLKKPETEPCKVKYSTNGRFDTPPVLNFKCLTLDDISLISMSDEDDLLPNVLNIFNGLKDDKNFDVYNMTTEEFLETLVWYKATYHNSIHEHPWFCKCQEELPESERKPCISEIDLKSVQFKTIEEADETLREFYSGIFKEMSDEDFNEFLKTKYTNVPEGMTKEKAIQELHVKEPFSITLSGNKYDFRFPRIGDMVKAQELANRKHSGKIRQINSEKYPEGMSLLAVKDIKSEKVEKVKKQIAKDIVLYARALSLKAKNGQSLSDDQKFEEWRKLPANTLYVLSEYNEMTEFGISDERQLKCQFCGQTVGRKLQQELIFIELLPISDTNKSSGGNRTHKVHIVV